jgi:hypothetical protein
MMRGDLGLAKMYDSCRRAAAANTRRPLAGWLAVVLGGVVLALFSTPAYVHHSGAMFDLSKRVTVTGTIIDFHWTNPHSNFEVSVPNKDGTTSVWAVEMNSPNNLIRDGWTRLTIKPGDKVTVTVRPLRDGTPGGQYVSIVLPDGKYLGGEQKRAGEK